MYLCAYAAAKSTHTHTFAHTTKAILAHTKALTTCKYQHCENGWLCQSFFFSFHSVVVTIRFSQTTPNNVCIIVPCCSFACSKRENVIALNACIHYTSKESFFVERRGKKTIENINSFGTRQPKMNWLGQKDQFFQQQRSDNHFCSRIFFSHFVI